MVSVSKRLRGDYNRDGTASECRYNDGVTVETWNLRIGSRGGTRDAGLRIRVHDIALFPVLICSSSDSANGHLLASSFLALLRTAALPRTNERHASRVCATWRHSSFTVIEKLDVAWHANRSIDRWLTEIDRFKDGQRETGHGSRWEIRSRENEYEHGHEVEIPQDKKSRISKGNLARIPWQWLA